MDAVAQLEAGQGTDLGGGVYKMRLARPDEGKRGGYRVIVFYRSEERTFFEYAFAKSDKDNINEKELRIFKKRSKINLTLTDEEIRNELRKRDLIEVI